MSRKHLNIQNKLTIIDQVSIGKYLQELSNDKDTAPLTPEMEYELFTEYKRTGNMAIKTRLIKANLRWVVTCAKQFSYDKVRVEDLINEGNIGMIGAIDKFDPSRGVTFLTFATWPIRQAIKDYIDNTSADIVQPANRYRINKLMTRAENMLMSEGNLNPTVDEMIDMYSRIKEHTDPVLTVADYNEIKTQTKGFVSMETPLPGVDGEEMNLGATFRSNGEYAADYEIAQADKKYDINCMLDRCLTLREKEIVEYSFGLNGKEEKTLEQISDIIELTRERVGQLLAGSLVKMKAEKSAVRELCGAEKGVVHCEESYFSKG